MKERWERDQYSSQSEAKLAFPELVDAESLVRNPRSGAKRAGATLCPGIP
jgi:hypothetical protein